MSRIKIWKIEEETWLIENSNEWLINFEVTKNPLFLKILRVLSSIIAAKDVISDIVLTLSVLTKSFDTLVVFAW